MKAVVDDKIPFIRPALDELMDEVTYLPGRQIAAADVRDADVLITRTRTRCNRALLQGSRVQFIATATIGFDHLDVEYLRKAGIQWTNCPGCNAPSVGQYVRNSLLLWARHTGCDLSQLTVGIIGVGHTGGEVLKALRPLGCRFLLNDPPRAEKEGADMFAPLSQLQRECHIICVHTPLVRGGKWPTYHLIDSHFLGALSQRPLLINCGRGEVVDDLALERAMDQGRLRQAIIDTWENEPHIRLSLLNKVFLGTPHIAGYSADGKANATRMVLEALCRFLHRPMTFHIQPPPLPDGTQLPAEPWDRALTLYNPQRDSDQLKQHPQDFEKLRDHYPLRRENV